jgi:hypothetical protein
VFTTRYALSPYIKQIGFVFKGINKALKNYNVTHPLDLYIYIIITGTQTRTSLRLRRPEKYIITFISWRFRISEISSHFSQGFQVSPFCPSDKKTSFEYDNESEEFMERHWRIKPKYSGKPLSQCYSVHHESQTDWSGLESDSPR